MSNTTTVTRVLRTLTSAFLLTFLVVPGAVATVSGPVEFAETRPDKALVYFIRTQRLTGAAHTMWLYADQTFVGVVDSGTYGYAHVDPGRRLFWTNWGASVGRELELVPGETYYLDVWMEIGVLGEARGRALIEKVGERVSPDAGEMARSVKHIRKRYSRAVERHAAKDRLVLEEVAAPPTPSDTEGLIRVPAYTAVALELLESVTSEFTPAGSHVLFRVAEDALVEGHVFVRGGTIVTGVVRESRQAGGLGKAGVLDIAVPAVPAGDGTAIPLVAQLAGAGRSREDVATALQLGLLPGLAVRGREAYYLAGDRFSARTRAEVWLRPTGATRAEDDAVASGPGDPPADVGDGLAEAVETGVDEVKVATDMTKPIKFTPHKGYRPDEVRLLLKAAAAPVEVWIERIGATDLPTPLPASGIARQGDDWICAFDGWSVVRFVRPDGGDGPTPIILRGRLADGRAFSGEAAARLQVELD